MCNLKWSERGDVLLYDLASYRVAAKPMLVTLMPTQDQTPGVTKPNNEISQQSSSNYQVVYLVQACRRSISPWRPANSYDF